MSTSFADHLLTGDHASRPAATAVPAGTLYACSDHDLIYQSDGATWATWATIGGASALDDLSDVVITAGASGDILRHNGTNWVDAAGIVGTDITSGTVPTARLGSGTADATTFLRGDQTYAAPPGGGGGDAAATLVQTIGPSTIASGGTLTLGAAPTDGNVILLFGFANQFVVTSITQTNVTWTKVIERNYASGNFSMGSVWKGVVAASGGTVITINFSGSNANGQHVWAAEFSGSVVVDAAGGNAGQGNNTRPDWGVTGISWADGGTFVAFCGSRAVAPVLNPTAKWTLFSGMPHDTTFTTQLSAGYHDATLNTAFVDVTGPTDNFSLMVVHLGA